MSVNSVSRNKIIPFPITAARRAKIKQYLEHLTDAATPIPARHEQAVNKPKINSQCDSDLSAYLDTLKAKTG